MAAEAMLRREARFALVKGSNARKPVYDKISCASRGALLSVSVEKDKRARNFVGTVEPERTRVVVDSASHPLRCHPNILEEQYLATRAPAISKALGDTAIETLLELGLKYFGGASTACVTG